MPSRIAFEVFAQAMPNQVWSATADGKLDWFNEQVLAFSGLSYEELVGDGWVRMVHPDDLKSAIANWTKALSDGLLYEMEFRLKRSDGAYHWHLARAVPIKDEHGNISRWVGTNTDIHAHKSAEAQQAILLQELEHRIKNTMAMVSAIAKQSFRTAQSKQEAESKLIGRLSALNQAHDVLIKGNWAHATLASAVTNALAPHRSGEDRFSIAGPHVELSPKQAMSLVLSLHELATNATKYGALSVPEGKIDIRWHVAETPESRSLRFEWLEFGGPAATAPSKVGFGSRLIQATLAADFNTKVAFEYLPSGMRCAFAAQIPR